MSLFQKTFGCYYCENVFQENQVVRRAKNNGDTKIVCKSCDRNNRMKKIKLLKD